MVSCKLQLVNTGSRKRKLLLSSSVLFAVLALALIVSASMWGQHLGGLESSSLVSLDEGQLQSDPLYWGLFISAIVSWLIALLSIVLWWRAKFGESQYVLIAAIASWIAPVAFTETFTVMLAVNDPIWMLWSGLLFLLFLTALITALVFWVVAISQARRIAAAPSSAASLR